tara:strand:- start:5707 stop:6063 length:357 start_codon:yes stop_codon:yes gene_type:complete
LLIIELSLSLKYNQKDQKDMSKETQNSELQLKVDSLELQKLFLTNSIIALDQSSSLKLIYISICEQEFEHKENVERLLLALIEAQEIAFKCNVVKESIAKFGSDLSFAEVKDMLNQKN